MSLKKRPPERGGGGDTAGFRQGLLLREQAYPALLLGLVCNRTLGKREADDFRRHEYPWNSNSLVLSSNCQCRSAPLLASRSWREDNIVLPSLPLSVSFLQTPYTSST